MWRVLTASTGHYVRVFPPLLQAALSLPQMGLDKQARLLLLHLRRTRGSGDCFHSTTAAEIYGL